MKDIKLSFPFPKTSRHNLSQDVALSLSMGMVIPARIVEVLPGDSHRVATSFSLISNPLVKPLLQGVKMRYCRFWVPRRIYHLSQRANNSGFDPMDAPVRHLEISGVRYPVAGNPSDGYKFYSNFQQSSLFDYLGYANLYTNFQSSLPIQSIINSPAPGMIVGDYLVFNAEPYLAYVDICRNFFGDSANDLIGWTTLYGSTTDASNSRVGVVLTPLKVLDQYIDGVQNSVGAVTPLNPASTGSSNPPIMRATSFNPEKINTPVEFSTGSFQCDDFGVAHVGFCVPLNRPDRLSRWFDLKPLTSQNAVVASSEITIANLSFLSKLQRYLTRKFFGGSRFTDVMYSVFGQKVPHVDSPVLLDVFDYEIGSELVASTNATESQNPGTLGGFFSSSGTLTTSSGSSRRRYSFNEAGYLVDVVYIMPRLFRTSFVPDYLSVEDDSRVGNEQRMQQGNFVPDFNGIGWQQPSFVNSARSLITSNNSGQVNVIDTVTIGNPKSFASEPSWQQYRTLPDVCFGALNPIRGRVARSPWTEIPSTVELNSPIFTFNDRPTGLPILPYPDTYARAGVGRLGYYAFSDPNELNRVFGVEELKQDNIFVVFRHSHQAKRQVSKRFTLSFS